MLSLSKPFINITKKQLATFNHKPHKLITKKHYKLWLAASKCSNQGEFHGQLSCTNKAFLGFVDAMTYCYGLN